MNDKQPEDTPQPTPEGTEIGPESAAKPDLGADTPPDAPQPAPSNLPPMPQGPYGPPVVMSQRSAGGFGQGFGKGIGLALGLSLGAVVLAIIAGIVSVASLAAIVSNFDDSAPDATTRLEPIWGDEGAAGKIRAVSVSGPIMTDSGEGGLFGTATYGYEVANQIDDLTENDASALVLLVNTPGGSITGSRAISDAIERYQERTGNKVYVHVEGMSASGGVYSTATADEIIADYGSLVGSIGVIMGNMPHYEGVTALGDVSTMTYVEAEQITMETLTAGRDKDFGNPFRPMTDEERAVYQSYLDTEYQAFIDQVTANRPIEEKTIRDDMGAHIFDTAKAKQYGLIDDVMNREEFFSYVAQQAGLDPEQTVVEKIAPPTGFESFFGATRAYGVAPALQARAGEETVVNQSFCSGTTPLVFSGDLTALCGR